MGYIVHYSPEFEKLSEEERLKVANLTITVFAIAVQTDGKPKILILKPGKCDSTWGWDNDILLGCIDISAPVIASYVKAPEGGVHIYISLLNEAGAIFL